MVEQGGQSVCIDEEVALDFVQGRLAEAEIERVDAHVDQCNQCRLVLAEATRAFRERAIAAPVSPRVSYTRFVPGDTLAERYQILRFIARGGMGEVYEADDLILNTRLALKTLAATISDDPHAIRRLKQEVNLARLITHPNVCRIFDLGVHEHSSPGPAHGLLFITMELVPGRSLGECLRTEGRLAPAKAAPIAQAMVAALGAAHRANVVHRDFKSDNVMLGPDDGETQRVVVMDFGLARAALAGDTSIDRPALAGTLPYMAPEQLEGKAVGPATDIYALGVVMFEMLTGELPFRGEPPLASAWKRLTEPAPALGSLVANLDPGWQRIVAACLERDPAARPASVEEVAHELQRLALGERPSQRPRPARITPTSFVAPPRPRLLVAGISVVVAALVLVMVARARRSPDQAPLPMPTAFSPARAEPSPPPAVASAPRSEPAVAVVPGAPSPSVSPPHTPAAGASRSGPPPRGRLARKHIREPETHATVFEPEARRAAAGTSASSAPEVPVSQASSSRLSGAPRRSADPENGFILP